MKKMCFFKLLSSYNWENASRRLKKGINYCLCLPKVVEDMKITKQRFKTMKCGHSGIVIPAH